MYIDYLAQKGELTKAQVDQAVAQGHELATQFKPVK